MESNGPEYTAHVRVTKPHALVMLRLLALADRYINIREPKETRHDREEAQSMLKRIRNPEHYICANQMSVN